MLAKELLEIIACPKCKSELELDDGLICRKCKRKYEVKGSIPVLLP